MVCKLWNVYHSKQGVRQGFLDTMINVDTGLKYLDIYYINWPTGFKVRIELICIYVYCEKIFFEGEFRS